MQRKSIETDLDLANKNIAALKQQIENLGMHFAYDDIMIIT